MPKDDWAKYASKDRGNSAARDGSGIKISRGKPKRKRRRGTRHVDGKIGICRCCEGRKIVGREDICLRCYKFYKDKVHVIANSRSGPYEPFGR